MSRCKLCGKNSEGLSLRSAYHKELGHIMVCQECWVRLWDDNRMVCGTGSGSGGTCAMDICPVSVLEAYIACRACEVQCEAQAITLIE